MGTRSDVPRHASPPDDPDVGTASRYGMVLVALFGLVGILLLVLSMAGGGWSYLLGAFDFLAIAVVLAWALRGDRRAGSA